MGSENKEIAESKATSYGTIEPKASVAAPKGWGARHTFCVLAFLLFLVNQSLRMNITIAIVAMVAPSDYSATNITTQIGQECPFPEEFFTQENLSSGSFDWSIQEQGIILGAFFYGFIVTMMPGAYLAERIGGKWILVGALFGGSVCTLLSPLVASKLGYESFVALRVIQGLLQGPVNPAGMNLIAKWIPAQERSRLVTLIFNGNQFGTIITLAVCGYVAQELGWQWVFYIFGAFGAFTGFLWVFLVHNSPNDHPNMSEKEKDFIYGDIEVSRHHKAPPAPYKQIFCSLPVWSLVIVYLGSGWVYYALLTETPTYLNDIQHFNLSSNGLLSALPHLSFVIVSSFLGFLSDWLVSSGKLQVGTLRKIMSALAVYGPALALVGLAFTKCNPSLAVFWLTLAMTLDAGMTVGFNLNQFELSPNYSGTIRGMASTLSNVMGFATPAVISAIIDGNNTLDAWKWSYLLAALMTVTTGTFFMFFGSTKTQKWNTYWLQDHEKEKAQNEK